MKINKLVLGLLLMLSTMSQAQNPLLQPYKTPHGAIPFDKIKLEHFKPAFEEGMKQQNKEVDAIVNQRSMPTFENTIEALENSGALLGRAISAFYNLTGAESTDELMNIQTEISPLLTKHLVAISLNERLFDRVKAVYDRREQLTLTPEQARLLETQYESFERSGATLKGEARERYGKLTEELSSLTTVFGQNVLKDSNKFEYVVTDPAKLSGLTENDIEMAAARAKRKNIEGWLFDISAPCYLGVMKNADNRDLRETIYRAYNSSAYHNDEFDNQENVRRIAAIRLEIAQLMGYENYATYALKESMAQTPVNVYNLLTQLRAAYMPAALRDMAEIMEFANEYNKPPFNFRPWDFSYYSEKLKNKKFDLNEEMLRPYFQLEKVIDGVFGLATELYGITFKQTTTVPVYNPEVKVYEVYDKNDKFLSLLYTDFFPRETKRSGAWMSSMRSQKYQINPKTKKSEDQRPHVVIVMNFTKPTATKPSLLSYNEVETFLHEFGHALHGMFADSQYESLSGTSVFRDFVELPSQMMENWLGEKAFLDRFAVHYETGETIPAELVKKINEAANYNAAYSCIRQLSFAYNDMAWHTLNAPYLGDVALFERNAIATTNLMAPVDGTNFSTSFSHIFAGGYAAGYYSYKWAEVLDADAYQVFKSAGIFNKDVAERFRREILSKGGSAHPMELYKNFKGGEPSIDAMMKRDGIKR